MCAKDSEDILETVGAARWSELPIDRESVASW